MSDRREPPKLEEFEKTFVQEPDTCDGETEAVQRLRVSQVDGGGGPFWRISTERWAFDSIEEIVQTLREAGVQEKVTP